MFKLRRILHAAWAVYCRYAARRFFREHPVEWQDRLERDLEQGHD